MTRVDVDGKDKVMRATMIGREMEIGKLVEAIRRKMFCVSNYDIFFLTQCILDE